MVPKADKVYESDNSGQLDGKGHRPHFPIIGFQHLYFAQREEGNCPFPGDYTKWFIAGIEQENAFHRLTQRDSR
jgi:hypothetical protein